MESPWPNQTPSTDREKAIEKLTRGRQFTNQLLRVITGKPIQNPNGFGFVSISCQEDLVDKILESFTSSISILTNSDSDEVAASSFPTSFGWRSEDSGESSKSSTKKDRRGCYKRRKCGVHTWQRDDSPFQLNDGHVWRKYGQKSILHSDYPRNYYRCTHKFDQKCEAHKHVQRIQEDPPIYRTTYFGHHTCENLLKPHRSISYSNDGTSSHDSFLLSFENNNSNNNTQTQQKPNNDFLSSFPLGMKLESNDNSIGLDDHKHALITNNPHSSDCLRTIFGSCTSSNCEDEDSFEIDYNGMMADIDFGDVSQFDF